MASPCNTYTLFFLLYNFSNPKFPKHIIHNYTYNILKKIHSIKTIKNPCPRYTSRDLERQQQKRIVSKR